MKRECTPGQTKQKIEMLNSVLLYMRKVVLLMVLPGSDTKAQFPEIIKLT